MWHTSQESKICAQFSRMSSCVCLYLREEQDLLNREPVALEEAVLSIAS
jgi:hypothetical protein